jgi:hypothetical protein
MSFQDFMKAPLNKSFPSLGKDDKKIDRLPVNTKVKEIGNAIKDNITDVKAKVTPYIWLGVIGLIVYEVSKQK